MLIDTHCHLNDVLAFPDVEAEVGAAKAAGVETMVVVGVKPDDWVRAISLAEKFDDIYAIVGWHPNYASEFSDASLTDLQKLLGHRKVLGLGEIGLDYHWDYAPREIQHAVLRSQLEIGKRLALPIVFHAREAYGDLLDVLEEFGPHDYLFHCFTGTTEDGIRAAALGACFGVDGPITYKKAHALRETIASIPTDRLVLETDAPYMAPAPFRGKPNRPAYIPYINAALAEVLGITVDQCSEVTSANARRFFRLGA